jgi:hypothetical protein
MNIVYHCVMNGNYVTSAIHKMWYGYFLSADLQQKMYGWTEKEPNSLAIDLVSKRSGGHELFSLARAVLVRVWHSVMLTWTLITSLQNVSLLITRNQCKYVTLRLLQSCLSNESNDSSRNVSHQFIQLCSLECHNVLSKFLENVFKSWKAG